MASAQGRHIYDRYAREVTVEITLEESVSVGRDEGVGVEIGVVEDRMEIDSMVSYSLERKDGMIDGSKTAVHHQDERQTARSYVVDGEEIVGDGDHQTAGTLDEDTIVAAEQFFRAVVDDVEGDVAAIDACSELRRAGVGVDQRCCGVVEILGKHLHIAEAAVSLDILRGADATGLYEFLSDDRQALLHPLRCKPCGAECLSGVGVDAADKKCRVP